MTSQPILVERVVDFKKHRETKLGRGKCSLVTRHSSGVHLASAFGIATLVHRKPSRALCHSR